MKMDKQRWQQIETLYHAALERSPDERTAFLADACADDSGLLREVEAFRRAILIFIISLAESLQLYHHHARLLLFLRGREGVYVVNGSGQVFEFREIGRQFGEILRRIEKEVNRSEVLLHSFGRRQVP